MLSQAERIDELLSHVPVMPVVVIDDADDAVPLADALLAGGIDAIEITLRTEAALPAIAAITKERPKMVLGAGTILAERDQLSAMDAGAQFTVSPGLTTLLATAAGKHMDQCPLLPGVGTASEAMRAEEAGFGRLKFFPAEPSGGAPMLGALAGPLPQLKFCPTGSIKPEGVAAYRKLNNVFCVGGSWITPKDKMAAKDWAGIEALARTASSL